jgi:hypothetical protein
VVCSALRLHSWINLAWRVRCFLRRWLAAQNRRRGVRALEAIGGETELSELWGLMLESRPSFEHIARLEASADPREF